MFKQVGLTPKEDRLHEIQSRSLDGCSRLGDEVFFLSLIVIPFSGRGSYHPLDRHESAAAREWNVDLVAP